MPEEKKESAIMKSLKTKNDPNSIVSKMQEGLGVEFLQGIISQIKPFISPMIDSVVESLGEGDEKVMCILKKSKKNGKAYVHIIKESGVEEFKLKEGALKNVIDAEKFIETVLSGDLSEMMKEEDKE